MSEKMTWHTEKRKVRELVPAEWNPRQMTKEQADALRASIETFDLVEIPAINTDNMILAGHQRVATLALLGRMDEEIDVRVPNRALTIDEAMRYNVTSNKVLGEFDMDKLLAMPEEILKSSGFSEKDIRKLVDGHTEAKEDDYDVEEGLKTPIRVEKGDIWQLGSHRLMCGDSTSREDVERLMDGKIADMAFTSPPYNAGKTVKIGGKDDKYELYDDDVDEIKWLSLVADALTTTIIFSKYQFFNIQQLAGNKIAFIDFFHQFKESFVDMAIWDKGTGTPALAHNVMNCAFEYVFIFSQEKNPKRSIKLRDFHGNINNVYHGSSQRSNEFSSIHRATFPIDLPSHFISSFAHNDSIILEPFCGIGTTLIACEQLGRSCYGMEIDPKYCTVILDRWEKLTGQKAIKMQQ